MFLKYSQNLEINWLNKRKFLENIIELMGYDLTPDRNFPAESKLNSINEWVRPKTGQTIHSFVDLVVFYHTYAPYLEMSITHMR